MSPTAKAPTSPERRPVCQNRRALYKYTIDDRLEAGLVLTGTEVKACRAGRANLTDAFVLVRGGEAFLVGGQIEPYAFGNRHNHAPGRERKLLLHRREIDRLFAKTREKGLTAVPLSLYFVGGRVKCEVGVGRGKTEVDRRQTLRARETGREMERAMREHKRGGS